MGEQIFQDGNLSFSSKYLNFKVILLNFILFIKAWILLFQLVSSLEWSLLVAKGAQIDQTSALPTK